MRHSSKLAVLIRLTTSAFTVKCMSSVTSRYFDDWEKRTVEFPAVRESGRGIEFEIFGADMISASVLSSFSFSLLCVIHDLTWWTHFCMDWMNLSTCCGRTDSCNWVSSAKEWRRTEWLSITSERGVVYRKKQQIPVGLRSWWSLGQSCSCFQLQFEFCLWGKKRTSGVQSHVCQRHVQDVGEERYGLLYQRQLIDQAE